MGGHNGDGEDTMDWSEKNENAFLGIVCEKVKRDPNGAPSFKPSDWHDMDEELFLAVGMRYGAERLKGKYHRLRIKHRLFSELLDHTGVTYDSNTNTVKATEDVWQMFYKKNKGYRALKKNGCKNYEMLGQVFNNSTATGQLHHASTQLPPTSDEERQNEEEFLNGGVHVSESEKSGSGRSKGKRTASDDNIFGGIRMKKESKFEKLDSCLEMWTVSLNARTERDLAKSKKYKSQSSQATSPISDPYSIDECMDVLEMMDNVSDNMYNKALEKFTNPDWRKMFIKMPIARRNAWLRNLA